MDRRQTSSRSFIPRRSPTCGSFPFDRPMRLSVSSTTGSRFEISVPQGETVEGLRRCLSQKLRVPRDRLVLLHKERQLNAGKLKDYGVTDDSKITMVPAVEAGLSTPRTEKTMMQALESLTEAQIGDFLSGRTPLTLALGVGVHTMYVQLQLAAQNVVGQQQPPQTGSAAWRSSKEQSADTESISVAPSGAVVPLSPTSAPPSPAAPSRQASPPVTCFPTPTPLTPRRLRADLGSPAPSSNSFPLTCHPHHSTPPSVTSHPSPSPHLPSPGRSASSLQTGCPIPSAPACSPAGPPSPVPATIFPESISHPSSSAKQQREPGAVIESFVNHSPGVFSGTFSGTLPAVNQSGISHPRRGIAIILQILNDLLSATRNHQGAPNTLSQLHCPVPTLPAGASSTPNNPSGATQTPPRAARTEYPHLSKTKGEGRYPQHSPTEENLALRRKLEQLRFRMRQRRLRGRPGRGPQYPHASHPYHCRAGHARSPGRQRVTRYQSKDSSPAGKVASPGDSEMEVMEESPWKPELTSDLVVV